MEPASEWPTSAGGSHGDMVVMAPEADLVAWLDAEFQPKLLRDDDLALRTDAMSHTYKYNRARRSEVRGGSVTAMANMRLPSVPDVPVPVVGDDELRRLSVTRSGVAPG